MRIKGKPCTSGAGFFAGTTIGLYAVKIDSPRMFTVGVVFILLSAIMAATLAIIATVERVNRDASAAFDLGRDIGHDQGYMEGRRVARPVVVPLSHHDCDHNAATGSEG